MIVAEDSRPKFSDFSDLMRRIDFFLNNEANSNQSILFTSGGRDLEPIVRDAAQECAKGTPFEGKITLISGGRFPDIVASKYYGIEVKSTQQDRWTSIGSSILESTRISDVERIFITFGKLGRPIKFLSRPYEECLSGIAVTHYPRYQIDMTLKAGETIFDKMGITYDQLRTMDNPVIPVSEYYKKHLGPGESLWWAGNQIEKEVPATVKLWGSLSPSEKDLYEAYSYVYFPECIMGRGNHKYSRMVLWLATQKGIINSNVRDSFSAGGKCILNDEFNTPHSMPAVFAKVREHIDDFKDIIFNTPTDVLREFWGNPVENNRINQWVRLVMKEVSEENKKLYESVLYRIFKDFELL